jgi:hypothetical protein
MFLSLCIFQACVCIKLTDNPFKATVLYTMPISVPYMIIIMPT